MFTVVHTGGPSVLDLFVPDKGQSWFQTAKEPANGGRLKLRREGMFEIGRLEGGPPRRSGFHQKWGTGA